MTFPDSRRIAEARPMSRPRFARRISRSSSLDTGLRASAYIQLWLIFSYSENVMSKAHAHFPRIVVRLLMTVNSSEFGHWHSTIRGNKLWNLGYKQTSQFRIRTRRECISSRAREFRTREDIRTCRHRRMEGASDLMPHPSERTGSYPAAPESISPDTRSLGIAVWKPH